MSNEYLGLNTTAGPKPLRASCFRPFQTTLRQSDLGHVQNKSAYWDVRYLFLLRTGRKGLNNTHKHQDPTNKDFQNSPSIGPKTSGPVYGIILFSVVFCSPAYYSGLGQFWAFLRRLLSCQTLPTIRQAPTTMIVLTSNPQSR